MLSYILTTTGLVESVNMAVELINGPHAGRILSDLYSSQRPAPIAAAR